MQSFPCKRCFEGTDQFENGISNTPNLAGLLDQQYNFSTCRTQILHETKMRQKRFKANHQSFWDNNIPRSTKLQSSGFSVLVCVDGVSAQRGGCWAEEVYRDSPMHPRPNPLHVERGMALDPAKRTVRRCQPDPLPVWAVPYPSPPSPLPAQSSRRPPDQETRMNPRVGHRAAERTAPQLDIRLDSHGFMGTRGEWQSGIYFFFLVGLLVGRGPVCFPQPKRCRFYLNIHRDVCAAFPLCTAVSTC